MELQWRRLILDDRGTCVGAALSHDVERSCLLLLPDETEFANQSWSALVMLSRTLCCERVLDFQLRDYWPAYVGKLAADLAAALAEGNSTFLWSRTGVLCLVGYAGLPCEAEPWCDLRQRFASAHEALCRIDPSTME